MKIIFLGFPKCGTVSFAESLNAAGFKAAHYYNDKGDVIADLIYKAICERKKMLHYVDEFDAITQMDCYRDNEYIFPQGQYHRLDDEYPGCKFILNTRDIDAHIKSISRWGDLMKRMQSSFNIKMFISLHYRHVREYFKSRHNFIEYNIDSDTDDKLTSFLGRKITLVHINKTL